MNKLLVALFAGAFAFGYVSALADDSDMKPLSKMDTREAKAASEAAKTKWASMTPEEKAATKKAAKAKKQSELNALEKFSESQSPLMGDFWSPHDPLYPDRMHLRRPPADQKSTPTERQ